MKEKYQSIIIVYVAMVFSVAIYCGLILVLNNQPGFSGMPLPAEQYRLIRYVLLGMAIFDFFFIKLLRQMLLRQAFSAFLKQSRVKGEPPPPPNFMPLEILTFAMCESVAIFGVLIFLIGKHPEDSVPFLVLSFLYFGIHFPRFSQWEAWEQILKSTRCEDENLLFRQSGNRT